MLRHINLTLLLLFSLSFFKSFAQPTQTIRGTVVDMDTKFPLIGAAVQLINTEEITGAITDVNGEFRLEKVPVGRVDLRISYIGYQEKIINDVIVGSGKEVILEIELEESATQLEEIEISATRNGEASNEMAMVSARQFSVEETDRYAGSRGDPSRMASNFAGVQGADDTRNDIVIRGNSPSGVLWRLENINIPNPNHFNIAGTSGGPVNIINNKYLANSDFFTGAFPAEFGNALSGVFDLKIRPGNDENYEFIGQLGFLGAEFFSEGPISKENKSSYLVGYRYSTLSLFSSLGIDIGTTAVPEYQDAAFNFNFPTRNGGKLNFFGIGGTSTVDIVLSNQEVFERNLFGENNKDQYFTSRMGVAGVHYVQPLSKKAMIDVSAAYSISNVDVNHDVINRQVVNDPDNPDILRFEYGTPRVAPLLDYTFTEPRVSGVINYFYKKDSRNTFTAGINTDLLMFNYIDSVRIIDSSSAQFDTWNIRWNTRSSALLIQPYVQWKHKFNDNLELSIGIHSQYFSLSNSFAPVEPRAGLKWALPNGQAITLGTGMHSQIQSPYLYFYSDSINAAGELELYNKDLGFTRSIHFVAGYSNVLSNNLILRSEVYYQSLYDVPVTITPSSYSLINTGVGFSRFFPEELENTGTGYNYGIELGLEQFFSNGFFFMVNGSLFESRYVGSDGIERDTDFNGNYIYNALATKEFTFGPTNGLSVGIKATGAGGRRYGPADLEASRRQQELVIVDDLRNTLQFPDYFRFDTRIAFFANALNARHEIALDLVNVFGIENVLSLTFVDDPDNPIIQENQLGFFPIFYYRFDF